MLAQCHGYNEILSGAIVHAEWRHRCNGATLIASLSPYLRMLCKLPCWRVYWVCGLEALLLVTVKPPSTLISNIALSLEYLDDVPRSSVQDVIRLRRRHCFGLSLKILILFSGHQHTRLENKAVYTPSILSSLSHSTFRLWSLLFKA